MSNHVHQQQQGRGNAPIHNQVRKIRQEEDEGINEQIPRHVMESRRQTAYREMTRQLSPSPLGRTGGQPISVGDWEGEAVEEEEQNKDLISSLNNCFLTVACEFEHGTWWVLVYRRVYVRYCEAIEQISIQAKAINKVKDYIEDEIKEFPKSQTWS